MQVRDKLFIDGSWVSSAGNQTIEVENPATQEIIGSIPAGVEEDVDRAVTAAAKAFPEWSARSLDERVKFVTRIQEVLSARTESMADTVTKELGTPRSMSVLLHSGLAVMDFMLSASAASEVPWEETVAGSNVVREPVGVVGAITPWNYPLHQISAKIAPALVAGCTVVLKPSEMTPLCVFELFEAFEEVDLPPGVVNLVTGTGPVVGEAIAKHPLVDMVSFTGSTRAGTRVAELAAATVKRVALELGGKSANIITEDADLSAAIPDAVSWCYINGGQTCIALTRLLVPRSRQHEIEDLVVKEAFTYTVGDPFDAATRIGPLSSKAQYDRVTGYIQKGVDEGAKLLLDGREVPEALRGGYYVGPTVFTDVERKMTIAQEEIFGPVLSILPYEDEADAIAIANDSQYGLSGSVWAGTREKAEAIARKIRTGTVGLNGGSFNPAAPFGGYKKSGYGREYGRYGIEEFTQLKTLLG